jgi:hypothetical protein
MYNDNNSNPVLLRVRITGNTANSEGTSGDGRGNGGGIYNSSSSPKLTNVIISGNTATRSGTGATTGMGGGIFIDSGSPELVNVLISGNLALVNGGGIFINGGSPELTNVTIAGNYANYGGAITKNNGTLTITNSVIWGNVIGTNYPGINNAGGSTPTISYSLVQSSNSTSNGNLDGTLSTNNPKFENLVAASSTTAQPGGDYRLQSGSPVIDKGDPGYSPAGDAALDLDATTRIKGGRVDMGAYEKQ